MQAPHTEPINMRASIDILRKEIVAQMTLPYIFMVPRTDFSISGYRGLHMNDRNPVQLQIGVEEVVTRIATIFSPKLSYLL